MQILHTDRHSYAALQSVKFRFTREGKIVMDVISNRRSIRKYKNKSVDESDILDIIRAASLAPSAKNRQPWKFIVYTDKAKEKLLSAMEEGLNREKYGNAVLPDSKFGLPDAFHTLDVMRQAPVIIAVLNTNGRTPYEPIGTDKRISEICDSLSIGAAIENMILEAEKKGLGSLWIANTCFAYPELVKEIGTEYQLASAVAIGYADESPAARPRKSIEDIIEFRRKL